MADADWAAKHPKDRFGRFMDKTGSQVPAASGDDGMLDGETMEAVGSLGSYTDNARLMKTTGVFPDGTDTAEELEDCQEFYDSEDLRVYMKTMRTAGGAWEAARAETAKRDAMLNCLAAHGIDRANGERLLDSIATEYAHRDTQDSCSRYLERTGHVETMEGEILPEEEAELADDNLWHSPGYAPHERDCYDEDDEAYDCIRNPSV